ncbi:MAG TPA: gephyrin-like molybdotransferase Glp [Thermoleophilaceae bacterium]
MNDLITIDEARRRVLSAVTRLGDEVVSLTDALGRVLAEDVSSTLPVPPFDSSAMDGFAVVAGPAAELAVVGEARAGHPFPGVVSPGQAVRISTGAVLPEGADAVVPIERTTAVKEAVSVPESAPGENVRRAGEDIPLDAVVLKAGIRLGPAELGVAASVGRAELKCAQKPKVAVLVTGDELTEPGAALEPGHIYSSNAYALNAQVHRAGGEVIQRITVPDDARGTRDALEGALEADVVIVSGGVSVGPHDHVKPALRDLGAEERFWGVSLRPGKPTWFGVRGGTLAFGLPGNPVSAMVTFQLFVRPALAAAQGAAADAPRVVATLERPIERNPHREQAVRVHLLQSQNGPTAAPTRDAQGSHVLTSMVGADGLALIAAGEGEAPAGERVEVELL